MDDVLMIDGDCSLSVVVDGDASLTLMGDGECGTFMPVKSDDYYTGETEITPSQDVQVLHTTEKVLATDITINPIPSNYGRIIWNGAYLRVE